MLKKALIIAREQKSGLQNARKERRRILLQLVIPIVAKVIFNMVNARVLRYVVYHP